MRPPCTGRSLRSLSRRDPPPQTRQTRRRPTEADAHDTEHLSSRLGSNETRRQVRLSTQWPLTSEQPLINITLYWEKNSSGKSSNLVVTASIEAKVFKSLTLGKAVTAICTTLCTRHIISVKRTSFPKSFIVRKKLQAKSSGVTELESWMVRLTPARTIFFTT